MGQPLVAAPARILLVDHADFLGGAERSLIELVRSLDRSQFEPLVVCPVGALRDEITRVSAAHIPIALQQVRRNRNPLEFASRLVAGVGALRLIICRERAAIVHSNTMRASVFAAPAVVGTGARFVWHVRDLHRERAYLRAMSRAADAIIVNSAAVQRTIPPGAQFKVTLIHNGVPLSDFDPARNSGVDFRRELGIAPDAPLVGNVGWLAPWKGIHHFVEAASLIARERPDAHFVIVGAASDPRYADYEQTMRALAGDLLGSRLIWAGSRSPIQPSLAALDLLLHCADDEPFGRALIEAMAMRVPVIAFRGGGPDEIIADNETGILVPPHDVSSLARHALELLGNPSRRLAMADAARHRVAACFDAEQTARKVEAVYRTLLARH